MLSVDLILYSFTLFLIALMHIFYNICCWKIMHSLSFRNLSMCTYLVKGETGNKWDLAQKGFGLGVKGKIAISYIYIDTSLDIFFRQITMLINVHVAFVLINTFYQSLSIKGYEDKRKGHMKFYEHCDLSKNYI